MPIYFKESNEGLPNSLNIHFFQEDHRQPYLQTVYAFKVDEEERTGFIEFNGYFYADVGSPQSESETCETCESWHPCPEHKRYGIEAKPQILLITEYGPSYTKPGNLYSTFRDAVWQEEYRIEFIKREFINNTNSYSEIDDNGEPMTVCFFPTDHQKLYFRILEGPKSKESQVKDEQ